MASTSARYFARLRRELSGVRVRRGRDGEGFLNGIVMRVFRILSSPLLLPAAHSLFHFDFLVLHPFRLLSSPSFIRLQTPLTPGNVICLCCARPPRWTVTSRLRERDVCVRACLETWITRRVSARNQFNPLNTPARAQGVAEGPSKGIAMLAPFPSAPSVSIFERCDISLLFAIRRDWEHP